MRPYYKLLELVDLGSGFLKFIKDPQQKDYDHINPKLDDALKRVNMILAVYPKPHDYYVVMFPQSIELHHMLLEIIDVSTRIELNKLEKLFYLWR